MAEPMYDAEDVETDLIHQFEIRQKNEPAGNVNTFYAVFDEGQDVLTTKFCETCDSRDCGCLDVLTTNGLEPEDEYERRTR